MRGINPYILSSSIVLFLASTLAGERLPHARISWRLVGSIAVAFGPISRTTSLIALLRTIISLNVLRVGLGRDDPSISCPNNDLLPVRHASNHHSFRHALNHCFSGHACRVDIDQTDVANTTSEIRRHFAGFGAIFVANDCGCGH